MKYTFLEKQLESLPPDVTVHQLLKVKQERMEREQAVRRKKIRKLWALVAQTLGWIMFGLLSAFLIVCVLVGAMYLTGGLT